MDEGHPETILLTRREALGLAGAAAGALVLGSAPVLAAAPLTGPGQVVVVHCPGLRDGPFPRADLARRAVDRAVCVLASETDPGRAWLRFVSPADRVLLKVNCLGTRFASTSTEITFAVADAIRDAGVADANILVLDMFAGNMTGGRYTLTGAAGRMRVLAHRDGTYDPGWTHAGPARVRFSEFARWATAVINLPPIKDHDLAGVTCAMKNVTFGLVEKPHLNHGVINEAIAHLFALEEIRGKVRLTLADGSAVLFDGGPKYNRAAHVVHDRIYASTDPVATDAVACELIEGLRAEAGLRSLNQVGRAPRFLELAAGLGLGIADRARIRLQTVELAGPATGGRAS
jgi:uncharacterized protein (DUF362 family)